MPGSSASMLTLISTCLDGLIMLDIHNLPAGFVSSLSKDQNEAEVARRLRRRDS